MGEKRFEVYAPVIIPTLCRYEHFKRCIDSLSKCTGAEFTDVYIGIDYPTKEEHWDGYRKICDYIKTVTGFNNLFVFIREQNYGVPGNSNDLVKRIKSVSDRYIFSEDDNEFSPNFLEYMNEGLTRFKEAPNVIKICGSKMDWSARFHVVVKGYKKNIFLAKDYNASGVGAWFGKNNNLITYTKTSVLNSWKLTYKAFQKRRCTAISRMLHQLKKESQLPDVCLRLSCAFHNYYCVFPTLSKVKNWGYDGTGLNSDNNIGLIEMQELDISDSFYMDDIEIKDYPDVERYVRKNYSESAVIRLEVMIKYLYYRITKKNLGDTGIYKMLKAPFLKMYNTIKQKK